MNWDYMWVVRDDGLHIYEDGQRIAKFDPEHFKHMIAEMAEHVRWQESREKKTGENHGAEKTNPSTGV